MRGYLILELDLDGDDPFQDVRRALTEADLTGVTHVHAAIGADGLHESVRYLLSEERS